MNYAITLYNNQVYPHFGKTPAFLLVHMNDLHISKEVVTTNGAGHGALVDFLKQHDVDTLVCGGIGQGARDALQEAGIALISGAKGDVEIVLQKLQDNTLVDDPSGACHHPHDHKSDCGGHTCSHSK